MDHNLRNTHENCASYWVISLDRHIGQNENDDVYMNKAIDKLTNSSSSDDWERLQSIYKMTSKPLSISELETLRRYKVAREPANRNMSCEKTISNLYETQNLLSLSEFCISRLLSGPVLDIKQMGIEKANARVRKWVEFGQLCNRLATGAYS